MKQGMWYFYILKSDVDNKLYYGSTGNLKNRLHLHNAGLVVSTKYRRPLELIYYEAYLEESTARSREHTVKSSRGKPLCTVKTHRNKSIGA